MRTTIVLLTLMMAMTSAEAVVCKRKNGSLALRSDTCKKREQAVSAADLGVVGTAGMQGPPGAPGPGARWALVSGTGTILAQSGGISVVFTDSGAHVLDFGESLAGKVLQATTAYTDAESAGDGRVNVGLCGGGAGRVTCDPGMNDDHHVFAYTVNASGTLNEPHPFFLAVF
ncbi:MAG TPA: hypothetical protein VMS22_08585 [Candidatus Eisenbacteria bacterium]|nr:hypothetical protein [Candidatus Eisenbacteria bacterium]